MIDPLTSQLSQIRISQNSLDMYILDFLNPKLGETITKLSLENKIDSDIPKTK